MKRTITFLLALFLFSCSKEYEFEKYKICQEINSIVIPELQSVADAFRNEYDVKGVEETSSKYLVHLDRGGIIELSKNISVSSLSIDVDHSDIYWTINDEYVFDPSGNKITAEVTPIIEIYRNELVISWDNGKSFSQVDVLPLRKGEEYYNIEETGNFIIKLYSGTEFIYSKVQTDFPQILSITFEAVNNPLRLLQDIQCELLDNSSYYCNLPFIVNDKLLVPTFDSKGDKVYCNDVEVISGNTVIDFSKPVTFTVKDGSGNELSYQINVTSFTGLPILYIDTEDRQPIISKDEYLAAKMKLVEDIFTKASGDIFESDVKIKGRGNSTWDMPKKPYKLKFDKKTSLLGEPADKEWVLLANYADKTSIRNELAFYMGRMSNLSYTCRTHYVELVVNNEYMGTYQLAEQQKIAESRVNVTDDGYLLEIDVRAADESDAVYFYISTIGTYVNIKDPDVEYDSERYQYIVNFINTISDVLFSENFNDPNEGWTKYLDIDSFVDWYIINEISKNNDASFFSSCYMHHKPGGKLYMGPIWDYDLAFGNVIYNNNMDYTGWWIKNVVWYSQLFKDPIFIDKVKERFNYFYSNKEKLYLEINSCADYLKFSSIENDNKWDVFYNKSWPNYTVLGSFNNEVNYLKSWLSNRMEWLKAEFDKM